MTVDQVNHYLDELMKAVTNLSEIKSASAQIVAWQTVHAAILENVYNDGYQMGFNEGYKHGKEDEEKIQNEKINKLTKDN